MTDLRQARALLDTTIDEKAFQQLVIETARRLGWLRNHRTDAENGTIETSKYKGSGAGGTARSTTRKGLATVPRDYITTPLYQRFLAKIQRLDSGCWQWTGFIDKAGYGRIRDGHGRAGESLYGHIVSYLIHCGPIPSNYELDHLCRNRWCVNPDHLEAVPHRINALRGEAPTVKLHRLGRCKNGHEINAQNTCFRRGTKKVVYCKICRREKRARQRDH